MKPSLPLLNFWDIALSFSGSAMAFLFGADTMKIIPSLVILIGVDSITGIARSLKNRVPIESSGMRRLAAKVMIYSGALIGAHHISQFDMGEFSGAVNVIAGALPFYLGLTEFKSIIENLNDAGFKIPFIEKLDSIMSGLAKRDRK